MSSTDSPTLVRRGGGERSEREATPAPIRGHMPKGSQRGKQDPSPDSSSTPLDPPKKPRRSGRKHKKTLVKEAKERARILKEERDRASALIVAANPALLNALGVLRDRDGLLSSEGRTDIVVRIKSRKLKKDDPLDAITSQFSDEEIGDALLLLDQTALTHLAILVTIAENAENAPRDRMQALDRIREISREVMTRSGRFATLTQQQTTVSRPDGSQIVVDRKTVELLRSQGERTREVLNQGPPTEEGTNYDTDIDIPVRQRLPRATGRRSLPGGRLAGPPVEVREHDRSGSEPELRASRSPPSKGDPPPGGSNLRGERQTGRYSGGPDVGGCSKGQDQADPPSEEVTKTEEEAFAEEESESADSTGGLLEQAQCRVVPLDGDPDGGDEVDRALGHRPPSQGTRQRGICAAGEKT